MSTLSLLEKGLRTPLNDRAFSLSFFCYFRAFTHYKLFVSFCSLSFGCKINRINPLLVLISSKLPAITNAIHKLLWVLQTIPNDSWNYKVPHLKSTNLNRIQVTTLTCCNIQVKQHSCSMLATAAGDYDVTNVTYNEDKYYAVTWIVYLESSMYLRRRHSNYVRSLLCATLLVGSVAVQCKSLTSFINQASSKLNQA